MGSAELSCASLEALLRQPGFVVSAVVTQPDRPKGRELKLHASPVKEIAAGAGLPVLQPARARDEAFLAALRGLQPELIVVVAFGQLLPATLLDLPRFGCVNVHTSLLPKYRGAAPIQWAIANGERETGVTLMQMDAGLDTGGILAQVATPIQGDDTSETLHRRLAQMGADLLTQTIPEVVGGRIQPRPQAADQATYAPKIRKDDGRIDWRLPAQVIANRLRAFAPWPGSFTWMPATPRLRLLKIWRAEVVPQTGQPGEILRADATGLVVACGQSALRLLTLQREGGRVLTAPEFLAGHPLRAGQVLG